MVLVGGVPGCSLFHCGESPQQQFIEAVQRGNSGQASQLWMTMNAEDRANFGYGIGFKPEVPVAAVTAALARQHKAAAADDGHSGNFTTVSTQTVEYPGLDMDLRAGNLQNLPNLTTVDPLPPATDKTN
jgi:hypothetical protein